MVFRSPFVTTIDRDTAHTACISIGYGETPAASLASTGRRRLAMVDALQNRYVPHSLSCGLDPARIGRRCRNASNGNFSLGEILVTLPHSAGSCGRVRILVCDKMQACRLWIAPHAPRSVFNQAGSAEKRRRDASWYGDSTANACRSEARVQSRVRQQV